MKILAIQTKGGVGKSTTSQQVLATYFLAKGEPVTLAEIDDENLDSAYLTKSDIATTQIRFGMAADASRVVEALMERGDENMVIDVGGNRTATNFIAAAGEAGFLDLVDLIVVPISSPGQDEINALRTIELIRRHSGTVKIVIAVTRQLVGNDEEFQSVFERYFDNEELSEAADAIIYLPQILALVHSRKLMKTLFEVARDKDDLASQLLSEMKDSQKRGDTKTAVKLSRIRTSVMQSGDALAFIEGAHRKLDQLVA